MNEQRLESRRAADQKIDPITANVIQGALENIAIEMGYKLMRMSLFQHHPRNRRILAPR